MKKYFWISLGLILVLSLGTWLTWAADGDDLQYYPMKPGNTWMYKVTTSDNAVFSQVVGVVTMQDGAVKLGILINGNPYAEVNFIKNEQGLFKTKQITPFGVIKYEPMQPSLFATMPIGYTWSWQSVDQKMKETGKIVAMEKVTVAAGTFDALVVQCNGIDDDGNSYTDKTWYVKGIGYVKNIQEVGGKTITTELTDYKLP